jgi:uncharacterized protein (UPF0276 family)
MKTLADTVDPNLISGHLAWSSYGSDFLNDLLPLPYTEESLRIVCSHIDQVQNALGRLYLVENPASYVGFKSSLMPETEFLQGLVERTGCRLLCDVSNVVVSAHNMGFDPYDYIDQIQADAVAEIHLGGFTPEDDEATADAELWIDTHAAPIAEQSWNLYRYALRRFGPKPTLIEWDNRLPRVADLLEEAGHADRILRSLEMEAVDAR